MRHRLLGIVIGSRATAVAIISHYYCYRSPCPTPPLLSSPPLPRSFPARRPILRRFAVRSADRPMEITRRVNLTLDLVSECASVDFFRFERFETGGWWLLKFYAIPSPLIFVRSLEVGGSLVPILLVILNWKCWNETERWWRCVRSPVWSNLKLLLLLRLKLYGIILRIIRWSQIESQIWRIIIYITNRCVVLYGKGYIWLYNSILNFHLRRNESASMK